MEKQLKKSEQITQSLSLVYDYDQPMTKMEEFESAFKDALGNIEVIKYGKERIHPIKYTHNNQDTYFLTAAITWLSGPHLLFKKRMQLKSWYQDFYDEYIHKENTDVKIVGVYRYDGMHIFVEFNIEDFIGNKCHNSSAHVYSNDLYQALKNEYFRKQDQNGNTITTISSKNFKKYIDGNIGGNIIFELFTKFNNDFPFEKWMTAKSTIEKMKSKECYGWREGEWAGYFLECKMKEFLEREQPINTMIFIGNDKTNYPDFDLYFENDDFYGDLKSSDINQNQVILNDKKNTDETLENNGKLWYIIYEHETKKDKNYNNEMAIERMKLMGTYKKGSKISYKKRMKHSVNYKKMLILEVNQINKHILKIHPQGRNSNGDERKPKYKILKRDIDDFTLYSYYNDK